MTLRRDTLKSKRVYEILAACLAVAVLALLQGCGSGPKTPANPSPNGGLQAIVISPATPLLQLAGNRQLTATGIYGDGSQQDLTSQVNWSAANVAIGGATTPNALAISSKGMVTGTALGSGVVSATLGDNVGTFQLTVNSNGYSSSTIGILPVLSGKSLVDAAYVPRSANTVQGVYVVQEVNLDADQSSAVLPVPVALMASVPMPAGFVPNVTAVSQASNLVAVISYTSPDVQIIDASNDPTDVTNNTVIEAFTAPVSKTVSFYGPGTQVPKLTCMICAAVVNPLNNQLILSTAQGYYSMDLTKGTFTALPFTAALPAPSFTLNPTAADPYLISPVPAESEIQFLDLTTGTVTTNATLGLAAPNASAIDLLSSDAVVVDAGANDQAILNLTKLQNPPVALVTGVGACAAPANMSMLALGLTVNVNPSLIAPLVFLGQPGGNCFGFEQWTADPLDFTLNDSYGYAPMPDTPDSKPFVNSSDPNAITTFASVVDKKDYGVLVNANQNWIAKVNPLIVTSFTTLGTLPSGSLIPAADLAAGMTGDAVIYLPTPGSVVTLSETNITFGDQPVATSSAANIITLTNLGINTDNLVISQIAFAGPNAKDFSQINSCVNPILPQTKCTINVTFTPSAQGLESATLTITDNGGASPQTVTLSGTGT